MFYFVNGYIQNLTQIVHLTVQIYKSTRKHIWMCNLMFLSLEIFFKVIFLHFSRKSPKCLFRSFLTKKTLSLLLRPQDRMPNISSTPRIGKRLSSTPRIADRQWRPTRPAIKFSRLSFQGGKAYRCDAKHSLHQVPVLKLHEAIARRPTSLHCIHKDNIFYLRSVLCDTVNSSLTLKM
jgi:hypothetical protein